MLTCDTDFGELAFRWGLPAAAIRCRQSMDPSGSISYGHYASVVGQTPTASTRMGRISPILGKAVYMGLFKRPQ